MSKLKEALAKQIPAMRNDIKAFVKEHGEKVIGELTIGAAFGGMRGLKAMVCDTSEVPPDKGLIIRGIPVKDLAGNLPEEIFWLLCVGTLPNKEELAGPAGGPQGPRQEAPRLRLRRHRRHAQRLAPHVPCSTRPSWSSSASPSSARATTRG